MCVVSKDVDFKRIESSSRMSFQAIVQSGNEYIFQFIASLTKEQAGRFKVVVGSSSFLVKDIIKVIFKQKTAEILKMEQKMGRLLN